MRGRTQYNIRLFCKWRRTCTNGGLCKTWTWDWTGLWTGLHGTEQNMQLYTDSERHQGYNSLSPARPQVDSLLLSPQGILFSISERSKVTCIFNKFQQRWLWLTPCRFCKWFWASMTCIYCSLQRPHASVGKAPSSIFDWALVRALCLLEGLEERLFCTETTLQPLLKCRKQKKYSSVIHDHSWSSFLLIKIICTWPLTSQKSRRWCLHRLRSNLRQSWRQTAVALVVFTVCN